MAYSKLAFKKGGAADIRSALGEVAKARSMTGMSKETGAALEALYKVLDKDGKPTLFMIWR